MTTRVGLVSLEPCPSEMSLAELQSLLVVLASELFTRDLRDAGDLVARSIGALAQARQALRGPSARTKPATSSGR